jgi:hypothetical protein
MPQAKPPPSLKKAITKLIKELIKTVFVRVAG